MSDCSPNSEKGVNIIIDIYIYMHVYECCFFRGLEIVCVDGTWVAFWEKCSRDWAQVIKNFIRF